MTEKKAGVTTDPFIATIYKKVRIQHTKAMEEPVEYIYISTH